MSKLIYSMTVSLDGFIADPNGEIDWTAPDEELHRFHNQQVQEIGTHFCGRRLYEEMLYWETADKNPSATEYELEFAQIWQALPKVVFSNTSTGSLSGRSFSVVARLISHPWSSESTWN